MWLSSVVVVTHQISSTAEAFKLEIQSIRARLSRAFSLRKYTRDDRRSGRELVVQPFPLGRTQTHLVSHALLQVLARPRTFKCMFPKIRHSLLRSPYRRGVDFSRSFITPRDPFSRHRLLAHLATVQRPRDTLTRYSHPSQMDNAFGNFDLLNRFQLESTNIVVSKWRSRKTGLSVVHLDYEGACCLREPY